MDDPSFSKAFLARHFTIEARPLLRVADVQNAALPMRLDSGEIGVLWHGIGQGWMSDPAALEVVRRLRSRGLFCPKVLPDDTFARYLARLG